jgi:hypothetical protein
MAARPASGQRSRVRRGRDRYQEDYLWDFPPPSAHSRKGIPVVSPQLLSLFMGVLEQYELPRRHGLVVEFYSYTSLKHTIRLVNGRYVLRISDLMIGSPPEVFEAVAHIMFAKITERRCPGEFEQTYNLYTSSPRALRKLDIIERERGWRFTCDPKGKYRDLEASFDRVNGRYFGGRLPRPELTWTQRRSRSHVGQYDETFNVLSVSRRLDSRHVPLYVLDYVVYHELLHMVYPIRMKEGRREVHSKQFLEAEKRFEDHAKAIRWLKGG